MNNDQRSVEYIDSSQLLADYCKQQGLPEKIGFDTEFLRVNTYYPKACLFQVATLDSLVLIDVLEIKDLTPFLDWLHHPDVMIVMHAAGQDLELLQNLAGRLPNNIFDTQIANAFLQEDGQLGYAGLVEQRLEISLEKSQSRTDWSRRPLSSAQKEYAVDDVRYLHQLQQILEDDLITNNFYDWFKQDCEKLESLKFSPSADDLLHRVKAKRGLTPEKLNVVRELAVWREEAAIKKNVPRKWLLADEILVALAETQPKDITELEEAQILSAKQLRRYGEQLVMVIETCSSSSEESWPVAGDSHTAEARNLLKRLQKEVKATAQNLDISPGLLASRKTLQALMNGDQDCALSTGWRHKELGQALIALLN